MESQKICKKKEIIKRLEEIKKSIEHDIGQTVDWYMEYFYKHGKQIGLLLVPRMIFPEIDVLGCYLSGSVKTGEISKNAVKFMRNYMGKINPDYQDLSGFIYLVYRHGLMHQHTPKLISYRKKTLGWSITLSDRDVPSKGHLKKSRNTIQIDVQQFYKDLIDSIDLYKMDFDNPKKIDRLVKNFYSASKAMNRPIPKTECLRKGRGKRYGRGYVKQSDFKFL